MPSSKTIELLIDTREQKIPSIPTVFEGYNVKIHRAALPTGDYSVRGFAGIGDEPKGITIERKQHWDEFARNCRTKDRPRFERELMRMRFFSTRVLLICQTMDELYMGGLRTRMPPHVIEANFKGLTQRHGIPAWAARYDDAGREILAICKRFLEQGKPGKTSTTTSNQPVEFTRGIAARIGDRLTALESNQISLMEQLDAKETHT